MTRGLILAAGRGSRLGPQTADKPKGLTQLAGRSLLEWQRSALADAGVAPVSAIGGYRADMVETVVPVAYVNHRWAETNMVGTLACAGDLLRREAVIVSYSDIAYHPDWVRSLLGAPPAPIAITFDRLWRDLWIQRSEDPLADAETFRVDAEGRLTEIGRRPESLDAVEGQYMGLLRFSPDGWRAVERLRSDLPEETWRRIDMTSLLARLLDRGVPVLALGGAGRWVEVDTPDDILAYHRLLELPEGEWRHDWRWVETGT